MTSDGAFRVIAAITTETAAQAARTQGLSGASALRLAELITGAVLLRETTQPGRRVQILEFRGQSADVSVAPQISPDDMPAHVKASLLGSSVTIPIGHGKLLLGTWQGIYLCEHRNQAEGRKLVLTVWGED